MTWVPAWRRRQVNVWHTMATPSIVTTSPSAMPSGARSAAPIAVTGVRGNR